MGDLKDSHDLIPWLDFFRRSQNESPPMSGNRSSERNTSPYSVAFRGLVLSNFVSFSLGYFIYYIFLFSSDSWP